MYWSDWSTVSKGGSSAKIGRAWMDGSNQAVFVQDNLHWPSGLNIDAKNKRLYWCDGYLDVIERINLDGTIREVFII